jgi:hypothetical protein
VRLGLGKTVDKQPGIIDLQFFPINLIFLHIIYNPCCTWNIPAAGPLHKLREITHLFLHGRWLGIMK